MGELDQYDRSRIVNATAPQIILNWQWLLLLVAVLIVCATLYQRCVQRTVELNGKVSVRYTWPFDITSLFWTTLSRHLRSISFHRAPALSLRQRRVMAQIFNCQEILFGTVLYSSGLVMVTSSTVSLFKVASSINPGLAFSLISAGLAFVHWGVMTVLNRQRNNPFS